MESFYRRHTKACLTGAVLVATLVILLVTLALIDWNLLKPAVARAISARTGRETAIQGDLRAHLLSWSPRFEINGLTIRNPPWAQAPVMFSAQRITMSVRLGRLLRGQIVMPQVTMIKPVINLERDKQGRSSWEFGTKTGTPDGNTKPAKIPTILSLVVEDGSLHVLDQIRKLRFQGSVAAADHTSAEDSSAFKIRARGSLNEKPFSLTVDGAPLRDLTPSTPYRFAAKVTAADIHLDTQVTVEKPFDLGLLDVAFVVTGKDLADCFYLTGLALPNTPPYRLAASVKVSGTTFTVDNLNGRIGSSDLSGKVLIETRSKIPQFTAELKSKTLNIVDLAPTLGAPVVNPSTSLSQGEPGKPERPAAAVTAFQKLHDRLLPDSELQVDRVRGMNANVSYTAESVITPKVPIKKVNMHVILDNGVLTIEPLAFVLDQGRFAGRVRIDARNNVPQSAVDMNIENVDLSQFRSAKMKQAPLEGSLNGRIQLKGQGDSVHKFASTAQGAVSIIIPSGEIEASIAELTGINVTRGLGLLLTKNEQKTAIRCSVANFQAQSGTLESKTLFIDTSDVLINGRGDIDLRDEKLNLEFKGDPKHIRFTRVRSPITVGGTLAHPAVGVDVKKLAGQAGVAAALGTLLAPIAAVIAFVDPGLAKNKDCAAALNQATEPASPPAQQR